MFHASYFCYFFMSVKTHSELKLKLLFSKARKEGDQKWQATNSSAIIKEPISYFSNVSTKHIAGGLQPNDPGAKNFKSPFTGVFRKCPTGYEIQCNMNENQITTTIRGSICMLICQ